MPHLQNEHTIPPLQHYHLTSFRDDARTILRQDDFVAFLQELVGANEVRPTFSYFDVRRLLLAIICEPIDTNFSFFLNVISTS